jgi:NADH-quinone oxidoreductase subunit H
MQDKLTTSILQSTFDNIFLLTLESLFLSITSILALLISIAFFTLSERKIIASVQRRKGPNIVGFWGLLQPLSDGLKLVLKEVIVPTSSNKGIFILAPFLTLFLSLSG